MVKAQITLTQDDIRQALTNFITENGFDMEGKDAEFSDLPDCITVDVVSDELPQQEAPKAKRAPRKAAEPKPTEAETVKAEVPPVAEDVKQAASAEVQDVLAQGKALLEQEKPTAPARPNPFATAPQAVQPTDPSEDDELDPEDQPLGQDILDAEPTEAKPVVEEQPKPVAPVRRNPFADPEPVAAQPTPTATPVKRDPAKSIFA